MIRYDVERDVLPLVLSNCQYSVEGGGKALPDYDLPKIQQQLLTRFLQGKPRITLNVSVSFSPAFTLSCSHTHTHTHTHNVSQCIPKLCLHTHTAQHIQYVFITESH